MNLKCLCSIEQFNLTFQSIYSIKQFNQTMSLTPHSTYQEIRQYCTLQYKTKVSDLMKYIDENYGYPFDFNLECYLKSNNPKTTTDFLICVRDYEQQRCENIISSTKLAICKLHLDELSDEYHKQYAQNREGEWGKNSFSTIVKDLFVKFPSRTEM